MARYGVTVVPVWELYCECGWSSCADTFTEAEDRAAYHEAEHQVPAKACSSCGCTAVKLGSPSICLKCHAAYVSHPSGGDAA